MMNARRATLLAVAIATGLASRFAAGQDCVSGEIQSSDDDRNYTGENEGDWFGIGVGRIGDILGYPTEEGVIVSGLFNGDEDDGRIYVVHKSAVDPYYYQISFNSHGHSAASAGDVDGDDTLDWIVGGGDVARIYSGASGGLIASFAGEASGDGFGQSVTSMGDLDANGYDDIAVGAPFNDAGGVDCQPNGDPGRVYVFLTPDGGYSSTPPTVNAEDADIIFTGNPGDWLGYDIAGRDVNDDGALDLIMTAPYARTFTQGCWGIGGKAYVYFVCQCLDTPVEFGGGAADLDDDVHVVITNVDQASFFGWSADGGRDFDGGGDSDILIGTYKWSEQGFGSTGKAYVFYGEDFIYPNCDCDPDTLLLDSEQDARVQITGRQDAEVYQGGGEGSISFGYDVAFADVNFDGLADVVVGAPYYDDGNDPELPLIPDLVDSGAVFVFYGTNSYTSFVDLNSDDHSDVKIVGTADGDLFGYSVANHGEANRDDYEDVIVGSPGYDNARGRVHVFFLCLPEP